MDSLKSTRQNREKTRIKYNMKTYMPARTAQSTKQRENDVHFALLLYILLYS